jgi:hypothetical protein
LYLLLLGYAALRRNNKEWLAWNQDNVSERGDLSICGLWPDQVSNPRCSLRQACQPLHNQFSQVLTNSRDQYKNQRNLVSFFLIVLFCKHFKLLHIGITQKWSHDNKWSYKGHHRSHVSIIKMFNHDTSFF